MEFGKRIESALDLPKGALTDEVFLELCGREQAILNGRCEIVQYDDGAVSLRAKGYIVRICGARLSIETLSADSAVVIGEIAAIEFL